MKTICVGGTSSNCGKTALICLLLKTLPDWAAIKVTPCRPEEACPHGKGCGACGAPRSRYETVTDLARLSLAGKDTARFLDCGSEKVVWVRAIPEFLPEAMEAALCQVAGAPGVIVESTTAIQFLEGLRILVTRTSLSEVKESARRSASKVDLVAVNLTPAEAEAPPRIVGRSGVACIHVCAIAPPEHPVNRRFAEACLARLSS